ncbi:MAG: DUF192 domain-containing protein [Novosphingobium sp.]
MTMVRWVATMAAVAFTVAACSPGSAERTTPGSVPEAARHPESGLPVIPLTVTGASGMHRFTVEVASTSAEQARGLMFRTAMGPDEGMIFPMDPPRMAAFWMKNTVLTLDIIYIGVDGRISNIAANAIPYSLSPIPSDGQVKGVLELNGGRAAQLGIVPGDKVEW